MAAGLLQYDWMMSAKEKPWHGIGTVVQDAPTSEDAIRLAKLDWDVIQYPISANGIEIPDYFANIRSDTNTSLGIVKDRYKIVQNIEAFDFVDGIVGNKHIECHYETAGSLFNGKKIFLCVKLPNNNLLGDEVENYLFFTNSHDGMSCLTAGITNVRVVCNNTLQMALDSAKRVWKCRHDSTIDGKKQQAKESLGLAIDYMDKMNQKAEQMYSIKVDEEAFIRKLFEVNPLHRPQGSLEESLERIHIIYNEKDDLQNFKGTAWGIYNAVADFVSNTKPQKKTATAQDYKLNDFFTGYKLLETSEKLLMAA